MIGPSIAWDNSGHLATPPLVSPRNDVWETSAEIPYWWRVTTQIWVVLLIGWSKFPTRHDQSKALPRVTRHHYGISARFSWSSCRVETSKGVAKCRLFSKAWTLRNWKTLRERNHWGSREVFQTYRQLKERVLNFEMENITSLTRWKITHFLTPRKAPQNSVSFH